MKKKLVFILKAVQFNLMVLLLNFSYAATGDSIGNAELIEVGPSDTYTKAAFNPAINNFSQYQIPHCSEVTLDGHWFKFTCFSSGNIDIAFDDPETVEALQVYTSSAGLNATQASELTRHPSVACLNTTQISGLAVTAGTSYYLFFYNGGVPEPPSFTLSVTTDANAALPVELTYFSATSSNSKVTLEWQTTTEVNNYGFEIERQQSENGTLNSEWETIGFVQGHGNSNSPKEYSFVDTRPFGENPPGGQLEYRLKQVDTDGTFEYYTITVETDYTITSVNDNEIPKDYELNQNYPNPFNPSTTITYSIIENTNVKISIYNPDGKIINELINEYKSPGNYSIIWNGKNASNNDVASGVYFYRLIAGNSDISKKMILIR